MKINVKREAEKRFDELVNGTIFEHNLRFYMTIEKHYNLDDEMINAVDLKDGSCQTFYDDDIVKVITNYDFTIK